MKFWCPICSVECFSHFDCNFSLQLSILIERREKQTQLNVVKYKYPWHPSLIFLLSVLLNLILGDLKPLKIFGSSSV